MIRLLDSEDEVGQLGAPRAQEAGQAQDLAGVDLEVKALQNARLAEPLDAQHRLPGPLGGGLTLRRGDALQVVKGLPEQLRDQLHLGQPGGLELPHQFAVPEHGDPVRHRVDLVDEVGHEEDGVPLGLQLPHHLEQLLDLAGVEAGGGLVEDQDLGLELQRAADGHHLLHRNGVVAEQLVDVDVQVEPLQDGLGAALHLAAVDEATARRLAPQ